MPKKGDLDFESRNHNKLGNPQLPKQS